MSYSIYSLTCPISKEVRYIGITEYPNQRKREHFSGAHLSRFDWIPKLKEAGLLPIFTILEGGLPREYAKRLEREWIDFYKDKGVVLLNDVNLINGAKYLIKAGISFNTKSTRVKVKVPETYQIMWRNRFTHGTAADIVRTKGICSRSVTSAYKLGVSNIKTIKAINEYLGIKQLWYNY